MSMVSIRPSLLKQRSTCLRPGATTRTRKRAKRQRRVEGARRYIFYVKGGGGRGWSFRAVRIGGSGDSW